MSAPALLWVDDEADALDSGATLLRLDGFRVDFATTVRVAIAMAEARAYDGVLLDLLLPDGSGLDVLRAIRKRRSMPVAILSGHLDFEAALAAGRLDVLEVCRKPLIGEDLVGLARRLTTGAPSRFDGLRSVEACLRSLGSRPADERVRANEILRDALLSPSLSTVDFLTVCRMVGATRDGRSPLLVLDTAASIGGCRCWRSVHPARATRSGLSLASAPSIHVAGTTSMA